MEEEAPVDFPAFIVVWDPELITEDEYAEIIVALGNVARAHGTQGVSLVYPQSFQAPIEAGVGV